MSGEATEKGQTIILSVVKPGCLYIDVMIGGKTSKFLIDTGSSVTIVSKSLYERVNTGGILNKDVNITLFSASNNEISILGTQEFSLSIGEHSYVHETVIADLECISGIIGIDFLVKYDGAIHFKARSLQLGGTTVKLIPEPTNICAKVRLCETVTVTPGSECILKGYIDGSYEASSGLVEPERFVQNKGLMMARSLVDTRKKETMFSVMNLTDKNVKLHQNTIVGKVQTVCDVHSDWSSDSAQPSDMLPAHLTGLVDDLPTSLSESEKERVVSLLISFSDIFKGPTQPLSGTDIVEHTIDTGDATPIKLPARRVPLKKKPIIDAEVKQMLDDGVIKPSNSPWAAPVVLVTKSDGSIRFCIDYRKLNAVTRKDAFPLPLIEDALQTLGHSRYFTTLDLASGYWQVKMADADKAKTAFVTHNGLFEFEVMPFGLSNAPATFSRLMELVLGGLKWTKCLCYLDDVIVFGADFDTALQNLHDVFLCLRKANLKLKPKKCKLFQTMVRYLGHIVSESGISCDREKVKSVQDWPIPTDVSDVRSFLGLAGYYRKFIPQFSAVASPLTKLTRKNRHFCWDEACQNAFDTIKNLLTSAPILAYPTSDDLFVLDTDASLTGIGAVLSQIQNGEERVIAYASKTLSRSQQNYCYAQRTLRRGSVYENVQTLFVGQAFCRAYRPCIPYVA